MNIRVVVPTYVLGADTWPNPLEAFGVKNNGDVRYRQQAVGQYTTDPAHFIGVVSASQYQPTTPLEYVHFGTTVRFIVVTISGVEERGTHAGNYDVLIVSPESQAPFALKC
jgi:hypothetical protein